MQETSDFDAKLSAILLDLVKSQKDVTIRETLNHFGVRGLPLAIIFFNAPFLQPIPLLGVSTPFGTLIGLCGLGIAFSANVWLPQRIANIVIKKEWIVMIGGAAHKVLSKIEKIAHPRAPLLVQKTRFLTGIVLFLLGIFLALPLAIPLTNFIPAGIILFLTIGLLEDDFVFIVLGYISTAISIVALYFAADLLIQFAKELLQ